MVDVWLKCLFIVSVAICARRPASSIKPFHQFGNIFKINFHIMWTNRSPLRGRAVGCDELLWNRFVDSENISKSISILCEQTGRPSGAWLALVLFFLRTGCPSGAGPLVVMNYYEIVSSIRKYFKINFHIMWTNRSPLRGLIIIGAVFSTYRSPLRGRAVGWNELLTANKIAMCFLLSTICDWNFQIEIHPVKWTWRLPTSAAAPSGLPVSSKIISARTKPRRGDLLYHSEIIFRICFEFLPLKIIR